MRRAGLRRGGGYMRCAPRGVRFHGEWGTERGGGGLGDVLSVGWAVVVVWVLVVLDEELAR